LQAFTGLQELSRRSRKTLLVETLTDPWVDEWPRDMYALERALLRRGVQDRDSSHERCGRCRRTPLPGERVYLTDAGPVMCELCRADEAQVRLHSRVVRAPNSGRAIRILASRAA
jgi:hypothetical protein